MAPKQHPPDAQYTLFLAKHCEVCMLLQIPQDDQSVVIFFRLPAQIWADKVHVVGDFNQWSTRDLPMRLGEQHWEARIVLPAGGSYHYAYLIDGHEWCTDTFAARQVGALPMPVTMLPVDIPQARRRVAAG